MFGFATTSKESLGRVTRSAGLIALVIFAGLCACPAQSAFASEKSTLAPLNRFPRMVQEYFVRRARAVEQRANRRRAELKTRADAEAYVRAVREKIQQSFGPWPERSSLKPRITGIVQRDAYNIEKLIFESRPGFLVTANLYVPKGRAFPLPGVVGTCGHSANGKASEFYQGFAQGLARQGYVVLLYDPISQGERLQYPDENLKSKIGVGVREHLYAGNQQFLVGDFFGSWRAWDGIRALDYLLTRKEVDPERIGVTGNSGGGTMTTWLCGVERRWTMGAPSCFVTTFRRNLENELPADTEQCPPRALALGLDHSDFLAAMAPEPIIILTKEKDYFDIRGSEEAYGRLKHLYGLLGAEDDIALFTGPTYHGYSQENREAMYRWFNRVTGVSRSQTEPDLSIEEDKTLWCTSNGQVCEVNSRPIYSFTKAKSQVLAKRRPRSLADSALKKRIRQTLRLPEQPSMQAPEYRILRNWRSRGYPKPRWTTYAVETEPGICAVVYRLSDERLMSRPPKGGKRAILYVAHHSSDAELREEPLIRELLEAEPDSAFYTCDVRGIGESRPNTCNRDSFLDPYGSDYFYAIHSIMLDKPYVGQRTHDVLRVLDWLKSHGHDEVHLVGKGWGALPATFAAVLSGQVKQVTLKNALTSYADIAESETYGWPLSSFVPGILKVFDLPDCYKALRGKQLRQIEPWGPGAQSVATHDRQPPQTRRDNVKEIIHGVEITDPYRWLEDQQSEETRAWIDAQNDYTHSLIDPLPGRERLAKRITEVMKIDRIRIPVERNGRYFLSKRSADQDQYVIYVRDGLRGKDEVLIDPHPMSADRTTNVGLLDVSRDGTVLVYAIREGGADEVTVKLLDVDTRTDLQDTLPKGRYFGVSIPPDKSGLYYSRHTEEGSRVYYHAMGTDPKTDVLLFGQGYSPDKGIDVGLSEDGRYLLIHVFHGAAARKMEVYVQDLAEKGPIVPIVNDIDARFVAEIGGDKLLMHTNYKAPNGRVLLVDLRNPARENWRQVIAETEAVIRSISLAGGRLFVNYLEDVVSKVKVFEPDGRFVRDIVFPTLGTVGGISGQWDRDEAFYVFSSFHVPTTIYRYDVDKGAQEIWSQLKVPVNSNMIEVDQVWYSSKDGTRVPMFLVHAKDTKLDGNNPTLLTGYGGFNISRTPRFSSSAVLWVENGGVFAMPNLRGGGEFGEQWHEAGMFGNKQNVFDDFIAAAEWLIENNYTKPPKLAIAGGSNGGLLVGAALTQRPDLFRAVVCSYPLLDMVRFHKFLLAKFWVSEYGSSEDPEQFEYLRAYSPYHNVKKGTEYPATLFITGDADTRVAPLHARKMAALLQSATGSQQPVLLLYDTKAGHSGGQPVSKQIEDETDEMSFLFWQLGMTK